jgi:hypothetical protein
MARTIPRTPRKGDYLSRCDDCGLPYLRRDLRRGSDGKLRCPVDAPGRNEMELARISAEDAARAAMTRDTTPADGAYPLEGADGRPSVNDYHGPIRRMTADEVYNGDEPTTFDQGTGAR